MDRAVIGNINIPGAAFAPLFGAVQFLKKGAEIADKAQKRAQKLRGSIEARTGRIGTMLQGRVQLDEVCAVVATQVVEHNISSNPYGFSPAEWNNIQAQTRHLIDEQWRVEELEILAKSVGRDREYMLAFADVSFLEA